MTQLDVQQHEVLPEGFRTRVLTMEDAETTSAIWGAITSKLGIVDEETADDHRRWWQSPNFDLSQSSIAIENAQGQMVAFATLNDHVPPPVYPRIEWLVHPDYEGRGLEAFLIRWGENLAQRAIDKCPPQARMAYRCSTFVGHAARESAMTQLGYQPIRYFLRMVIHMEEAPPQPVFPAGISMRSFKYPDELDAVIEADNDGFRDHWGHVERPLEELRKFWSHWLSTDPNFDPAHFWLAIDDATQEIAAVCLCFKDWDPDPNYAYIDSLAVRKPYRKQGLGLALLHYSFGQFWEMGRKNVALHVDATSLTGATRLYEKAGMHADHRWASWEKLIRDGEELATTSVPG